MMWLDVFFCLFGVRSLAQIIQIYVIRNWYRQRNKYHLLKTLIIDGLIIAWLVYGNAIYYSQKNDCGRNERTQFLDQFMKLILFLGYIMMALYLLALCTLPFLFYYVQQQLSQNLHEDNAQ